MSIASPTQIVVAIIERGGNLLITQRRLTDRFPGLWEFPGGKVNPEESPNQALSRECLEEVGVEIEVGQIKDVIFHEYDTFSVLILFYHCVIWGGGELRPFECETFRWVSRGELSDYRFLPGDQVLIRKLRAKIMGA